MATSKIPLYNGNNEIIDYASIDEFNYNSLMKWKWRVIDGYAARSYHRKNIWMHRVIMNCPDNKVVDHINHNRKDNRISNLRICSIKQNSQNKLKVSMETSSKYKGVSMKGERWSAHIKTNKVMKSLGVFSTELEAAKAYNIEARNIFGEFAGLNDIDEDSIEIIYKYNKSSYRGVTASRLNWYASIKINKKLIPIGRFKTEIEAAIAYNLVAKSLLGDNARVNEIPCQYSNVIPIKLRRYACKSKSGYIGVYPEKGNKKWFSRIEINGEVKRLGNFVNKVDAAKKYDEISWSTYHNLDILNFPEDYQR